MRRRPTASPWSPSTGPGLGNGVVPELSRDLPHSREPDNARMIFPVIQRLVASVAAFVEHREPVFNGSDAPSVRPEEGS